MFDQEILHICLFTQSTNQGSRCTIHIDKCSDTPDYVCQTAFTSAGTTKGPWIYDIVPSYPACLCICILPLMHQSATSPHVAHCSRGSPVVVT